MKRWLCMLLCVLLLIAASALPVQAAGDFTVENGVLIRYSGTAKNVTVPDDVQIIGESAFEGCDIQSVTLSSAVAVIEDRAFCDCTALSAVNGGVNVSRVGAFAFRNTPYLISSTEKYLTLGKVLVWYNGTSSSAVIPLSCEAVAPYAFMRSAELKSVRSDGSLIEIGTGAFYGCSGLSSVVLPSSVSEVGAYAFDGTPYLSSLGAFATVGDGVLVKYQGYDTNVTIPGSVRRIASAAFMTQSKITSVTIPRGVYSIDPYAFADCVGLREVKLPEGLVNIGDGAFRGCKSLGEVLTPSTLRYLGQHAFDGDEALEGAHLSGNGLTVSYDAFKGCGLRYVLMNRGVGTLHSGAFSGCTQLRGVSISSDTSLIDADSLVGCKNAAVACADSSAAASVLSSNRNGAVKGDVDSDGYMSVMDVTLIQRYLSQMIPLNGLQMSCADIDYDADIAVTDVTVMQKVLVDIMPMPV